MLEKRLQVALRSLRQGLLGLLELGELQLGRLQFTLDIGQLFLPVVKYALQDFLQRCVVCVLQQAGDVLDRSLRDRELFPVIGNAFLEVGFRPHMAGHVLHFFQRGAYQ